MENRAPHIVIIARHRHIDARPTTTTEAPTAWPADIQQALNEGRISFRRAEALAARRAA